LQPAHLFLLFFNLIDAQPVKFLRYIPIDLLLLSLFHRLHGLLLLLYRHGTFFFLRLLAVVQMNFQVFPGALPLAPLLLHHTKDSQFASHLLRQNSVCEVFHRGLLAAQWTFRFFFVLLADVKPLDDAVFAKRYGDTSVAVAFGILCRRSSTSSVSKHGLNHKTQLLKTYF